MNILVTENLKKYYRMGENVVKALDGVSISIQQGEFLAIVGKSGSGKSTLLHMLGGLDRPTSGKVMIEQKDISSMDKDELTIFRRRKIGFVFQNYNLLPLMNVYENIVLPIKLDGIRPQKRHVNEIIEMLGLGDKKSAMPSQLSGGQQQRVALARALAAKPAIVLADEPTGNLDSRTSQDVLGLIKTSSERFGQTVVMITHNTEIAQMAAGSSGWKMGRSAEVARLMTKINNRKVISQIAATTYKANKKRNVLTIFAIILTTFLIGVVFAVGMSYWNTISLRQMRMSGMDYDIELTEPEQSQVKIIRAMDKVEAAGVTVKCAIAEKYEDKELDKVQLYWMDQTAWEKQCIPALESHEGTYPKKKSEIMLSTDALHAMGITNPKPGMAITLEYFTLSDENEAQESEQEEFILSGWFRDYSGRSRGFVSREFYDRSGARQTDLTQGELLITLKSPIYSKKDIVDMQNAISLGKMQSLLADYDTISNFLKTAAILLGMMAMILLSGYLFIYNMLYISISKDIRYYGQLKTIGMTSGQMKRMITKEVVWNCAIGIPLGLLLSLIVSKGVILQILQIVNPTLDPAEITVIKPWIYLLAAAFAFLTNQAGSRKPAKIAGDCSPVEAMRYIPESGKRKKGRERDAGIGAMAVRNITRDKKQAVVIYASFIVAVTVFLIMNVVVKENDAKSILNATYNYDIRFKNETTLDDQKALAYERKDPGNLQDKRG